MEAGRSNDAIIVRVYLAGTETQRNLLLRRIRSWEHTPGATIFTGVAGFGASGTASGEAVPTVLEFFDEPDRALRVIDDLKTVADAAHIVYWPVSVVPASASAGRDR